MNVDPENGGAAVLVKKYDPAAQPDESKVAGMPNNAIAGRYDTTGSSY